jgi:hypothetical protein
MPRFIRLKEYEPLARIVNVPPDWYFAQADSSLAREEYVMNIDPNGFIRAAGDEIDDRAFVVVLGDSVVESMFAREEHRFCSVAQHVLNTECGLRVRVLNGGYSGATSLHLFNVFVNKILPLRPAAVILMSGIVDVDVTWKVSSFWSNDCWLEPIVSTDRVNTDRDANDRPTPSFADRGRILTMFAHTGALFGIPVWYATVPHLQIHQGEYVARHRTDANEFRKIVDMRRRVNNVTRRFCLEGGHHLFDLELDLIGEVQIYYDMFHLNGIGGPLVGRRLVECGLAVSLEEVRPRPLTR